MKRPCCLANNTSTNISLVSFSIDIVFPYPVHLLLNVLYTVLIVVSVIVNGFVIAALRRQRKRHTPMSYLLLNLSIADSIGSLGFLPYVYITNVGNLRVSRQVETFLCALSNGFHIFCVSGGAALFTLCAISCNRYLAIAHPLRRHLTLNITSVKILTYVFWIASFALMFPSMLTLHYSKKQGTCVRAQKDTTKEKFYRSFLLLATFAIPLTFLFVTYAALRKTGRRIFPNLDETSQRKRAKIANRAEKLVRYLILNFIMCWAPFLSYWAVTTFTETFQPNRDGYIKKLKYVRISALFLVLQCVIEPTLYVKGNPELKSDIIRHVSELCCCTQQKRSRVSIIGKTTSSGKTNVTSGS